MREIDHKIWELFAKWESWSVSNTQVSVQDWNVYVLLHGNIIAARPEDSQDLTFNLKVEWQTQTTKNRINWILEAMNYPLQIKATKTIWFFVHEDGDKWPVTNWINFIHK